MSFFLFLGGPNTSNAAAKRFISGCGGGSSKRLTQSLMLACSSLNADMQGSLILSDQQLVQSQHPLDRMSRFLVSDRFSNFEDDGTIIHIPINPQNAFGIC